MSVLIEWCTKEKDLGGHGLHRLHSVGKKRWEEAVGSFGRWREKSEVFILRSMILCG